MKIHNLPSFLLTLLMLSIAIEVNASAFDASISITGTTTFDDGFANLLPNSFLDKDEKKYFKYFFH